MFKDFFACRPDCGYERYMFNRNFERGCERCNCDCCCIRSCCCNCRPCCCYARPCRKNSKIGIGCGCIGLVAAILLFCCL